MFTSPIKFTKTYNHPISKVWSAIGNRDALRPWLMPCDFEPVEGHEFEFRTKPYPGFDGIVKCKVLKIEPEKTLVISWSGGSLENTKVTFNLTPLDNGYTRLDFEHSGFEGMVNKLITKNILGRGWKRTLLSKNLVKYLQS